MLTPNEAALIDQYREVLPTASYDYALEIYRSLKNYASNGIIAEVCKFDRYFLLLGILRAGYAGHKWIYERCREVEANPDDHLDLWARGHFKSTTITFAGSFQEIIKNPEITIGIFSNDRPTAKSFLWQIQQEAEINGNLSMLWPDIFWKNPKREAPVWSLDNGLCFKRKHNPKEPTVSAWGLVDSQPTSKHFDLRIYDDVVTEDSVGTPDMILKTTERWELSQNLAKLEMDEFSKARQWHIGTRYHFADTYHTIIDRGALKERIYPATDDGTRDGKPVLLTQDAWEKKLKSESTHTIACQQLLNPLAGDQAEFKPEWIRRYEVRPEVLSVAILCDPAGSKNKASCNTAMPVIGMDQHFNKYLLDGACHKMSLNERWYMLKGLVAKWRRAKGVQVVMVGYERYGMQSDIEHFETMMKIENYAFPIEEVSWTREHVDAKDDRIRRLEPDHRSWRFFYPYEGEMTKLQLQALDRGKGHLIAKPIKRINEEGKVYNVFDYFYHNEYLFFPATTKKDFMDAMSRLYDLEDFNPPMIYNEADLIPEHAGDT